MGNPASDSSALGEEHFSAADFLFRTHAEPGSECGCITKAGNIRADLAEDRLGCHCTDARHVRQINSEDPIEFAAKIEHTRFVPLPLVWQTLGSLRHLGQCVVCGLQFDHLALNLLIRFQHQLLIVAVRCQ